MDLELLKLLFEFYWIGFIFKSRQPVVYVFMLTIVSIVAHGRFVCVKSNESSDHVKDSIYELFEFID